MARKPKYREQTDVVSIRMPLSLIEKLDALCVRLGVGRADIIVDVLLHYPTRPNPKRIRMWLANLALLICGGGLAIFAASHGVSTGIGDGLAPARALSRGETRLESSVPGGTPGAEGRVAPPLPLRDLRHDPEWWPGSLQYAIPRNVPSMQAAPGDPTDEKPLPDSPQDDGRNP